MKLCLLVFVLLAYISRHYTTLNLVAIGLQSRTFVNEKSAQRDANTARWM